ncbi:MAG: hypothetical protein B7X04_01195 [Parcubacteria group bacterium 21-54-25]|nr:MAG: hypothetical protein B7X04_01195 [Parcubacteria group bacterium 21-54-25]HQU07550.1 YHYH protein [Candidatus Paceibacterota bacterium]
MLTPRGLVFGLLGLFLFSATALWFLVQANAPAPVGGSIPDVLQQGTASSTAFATSSQVVAGNATGSPFASTSPSATTSALDLHAIPLGDGQVSTSPQVGYVYSCTTSFPTVDANHTGPWIHGDTWDPTQKIPVAGQVFWPQATFSNIVKGATRFITGNGLPVNEPTGVFPISPSDPAYQYDHNPNSIQAQNIFYALPAQPIFSAAPSCVPMGPIGVALDGVPIYNALDANGRDAVAHEIQDSCNGHPQSAGQYHYHGPSPCMPNVNERNTVVGYALDGFPITSLYDAQGNLYTNAELDVCHGTTTPITMNGQTVTTYHYVLTEEYPYTIGCFRGTPVVGAAHTATQDASGSAGSSPPQAAITACGGKPIGASCNAPSSAGTCRTMPDGSFACVPG